MKNIMILISVALIPFMTDSRASADLVINGGFETGDFSGWTLDGDPAGNVVSSGFPHTGIFAAFLGEADRLGSLSQTLTTTPGTEYTFSFWFAGDGSSPSQFTASVDGNEVLNIVDPPLQEQYGLYSYNFTPSNTSTEVKFIFRNDVFFLNLDDVSVVPATIPEPASMISLGIGLLALAGYTWHRRRRSTR